MTRRRALLLALGAVLAVFLAITGFWLSGIFYPDDYRAMVVSWRAPEPWMQDAAVHLDPEDVSRRVPFFAEAMKRAQVVGSADIEDGEQIEAVWLYLDELTGKQDRGHLVEHEGSFFSVGLIVN